MVCLFQVVPSKIEAFVPGTNASDSESFSYRRTKKAGYPTINNLEINLKSDIPELNQEAVLSFPV